MQQKLRIVQVIDILNTGGAERVLVNLANLLHQKGHEVKVVTTVGAGPLSRQLDPGITFQNLGRKWKWNPVTMYRLVQAVKDYDIIHVHSRHNLRYLFLAKSLFGVKKKIFYHEHHGARIHTKATAVEKKIFPQTIFIAVSEALRNWAITEAAVAAANAFVLPNIVLKENVVPVSKKDDAIQLVVTANFVPVKNIAFAVEILERLLQREEEKFHLTIIGAIADIGYYNSVVTIIKEKKLEEHISFVHDCTNVQQLLSQFDLAIHTSTSESGPLVLIEYMAQQLPFISYETGEVVEQVKDALPDMIMQHLDAGAWATRVLTILQANKLVTRDRLQETFNAHYSPEKYYQQCMLIYGKA